MTRHEAETTVRSATAALLALEQQDRSTLHRIHGATLVLAQALAASGRMSDGDALATLARAAELAAEVLLLRAVPRIAGAAAAIVEEAGSELLALSHRHAIHQAIAAASAADRADSHRRSHG